MMFHDTKRLCIRFAWIALVLATGIASAQDNVRDRSEPIVESIDVSILTYDILVDASLPSDDPASNRYTNLPAAYAAASAGTEARPTVIGIKPGVYLIPCGPVSPSLRIDKDWITLLGLTNNRRAVVIADNRGNQQGAADNGFLLDVNADGFTCRNLTIVNYCNLDYEYPGDPSKNLAKRSDVITQAVALQAAGDKHVYENVAILSRLDTMFLRTTRSYFKNVFIEGTDDWLGGGQVGVWQDCTLFFPEGEGVFIGINLAFRNCRFEAANGFRFYKVGFGSHNRPSAVIDCIVPPSTPNRRVAWMREPAPPRPSYYSLTRNVRDTNGNPAPVFDSAAGEPAFDYTHTLNEQQALAFNPWNMLRAVPGQQPDDWDPAGAREQYADHGAVVFRVTLNDGSAANYGDPSLFSGRARPQTEFKIRTGESSATIGATVIPVYAADTTITWSTASDLVKLDRASGPVVTVTGSNTTEHPEWVAIDATAHNGLKATAWVYVEPAFTDPPAVIAGPAIAPPANGELSFSYSLNLDGRLDQSLVTWSVCDDATGANPRAIAVSRGDEPAKTLTLTPGHVGKYISASIQPKHQISNPGEAVTVTMKSPIDAADIPNPNVISPNFRYFNAYSSGEFADDLWTLTSNWSIEPGDALQNGWGIRPNNAGKLLYQQDDPTGDMTVDLLLWPEKTAGQVFSVPGTPGDPSATNLSAEIYIKYDPRTGNGYSLRFWRTTEDSNAVKFQFFKIENGTGVPLDSQQVPTGVVKRTCNITIKAVGNKLIATGSNTSDDQTLHLESSITPNEFGGTGVAWCRGSAATISRFEIRYP